MSFSKNSIMPRKQLNFPDTTSIPYPRKFLHFAYSLFHSLKLATEQVTSNLNLQDASRDCLWRTDDFR